MPLLSFEEYNKKQYECPYKIVIKLDNNVLYYFGEMHSFNPADPQWTEEKLFWQNYLQDSRNKKRIVFVEGRIRHVEQTEERTILKEGGMGFITYLASQEGIPTYCSEPDRKLERLILEKHFPKESIQYYYFARQVLQWNTMQHPKPEFEEYITRYLDKDKEVSDWKNFDFSLASMKQIHSKIFMSEFDKNNKDFFYGTIVPTILNSEINKVARMSMIIRDEHIVKEIEKYIKEGYSVYAQYGCSHVVMQEPLLRESLV